MPFTDRLSLEKCERCDNYFSVRRIFNIRPYNPNGKTVQKMFNGIMKDVIEQEPVLLCQNCRTRIWQWITGESYKFQAPTKGYTKPLDQFEGFNND